MPPPPSLAAVTTLLLDLDDCLYRYERAPALVRAAIERE
jgi:hypothetical protein